VADSEPSPAGMVLGQTPPRQSVQQLFVVLWQSCNEIARCDIATKNKEGALRERLPSSVRSNR
jgi:hypothetical protein